MTPVEEGTPIRLRRSCALRNPAFRKPGVCIRLEAKA